MARLSFLPLLLSLVFVSPMPPPSAPDAPTPAAYDVSDDDLLGSGL